jgi:hypothetical protein
LVGLESNLSIAAANDNDDGNDITSPREKRPIPQIDNSAPSDADFNSQSGALPYFSNTSSWSSALSTGLNLGLP